MSCAEVFSCALLLKGGERAGRILDLLDEDKQKEVKAVLETLRGMPPDSVRQLWRERRKADELIHSTFD